MEKLKDRIIELLKQHGGQVAEEDSFWLENTEADDMGTINKAFKALQAEGQASYYREGTGYTEAKLLNNED